MKAMKAMQKRIRAWLKNWRKTLQTVVILVAVISLATWLSIWIYSEALAWNTHAVAAWWTAFAAAGITMSIYGTVTNLIAMVRMLPRHPRRNGGFMRLAWESARTHAIRGLVHTIFLALGILGLLAPESPRPASQATLLLLLAALLMFIQSLWSLIDFQRTAWEDAKLQEETGDPDARA